MVSEDRRILNDEFFRMPTMRVVEWIGRVLVEHVNFLVIVLFHGLLRKKNSVALSTAEAEYVAVGACCAQVLWMKHTLSLILTCIMTI